MDVKFLGEEELCRTRRLRILLKRYIINGREVSGDSLRFGDSVAIIPLIKKDKIILIKQFRIPLGRTIYEIPAGRIEEGESLFEAANRELVEETGYSPKKLRYLTSIYVSPGYSDEVIHIVIGEELTYIGARREEDEAIDTLEVSLDDAIRMIFSGEINDAKTIIGLLYYHLETI